MCKESIGLHPSPDNVNHPFHYQGKYECIDEMIALFGVDAVRHFCMCNVYKYWTIVNKVDRRREKNQKRSSN